MESRVRYYGDDVAAVVADTPLHALLAAEQVRVEYEEYPPMTPKKLSETHVLHDFRPNNELSRMDFTIDIKGVRFIPLISPLRTKSPERRI